MSKTAIRQAVRLKRDSLPASYLESGGQRIAEKLIASETFRKACCLFVYISTSKEPSTWPILEAAWKSGKTVCVPRCNPGHTMDAVPIYGFQDLRIGRYGLSEPSPDMPSLSPERIDLAVIPCLAADLSGHRLGHGGGFYDRFLKSTHARKVCLCFDLFLLNEVPFSEMDVPMDEVISESHFLCLTKS